MNKFIALASFAALLAPAAAFADAPTFSTGADVYDHEQVSVTGCSGLGWDGDALNTLVLFGAGGNQLQTFTSCADDIQGFLNSETANIFEVDGTILSPGTYRWALYDEMTYEDNYDAGSSWVYSVGSFQAISGNRP